MKAKQLLSAGACALMILGLASCNSEVKLPTDTPIVQEYSLIQINDAQPIAGANFRGFFGDGQTHIATKLNNGASISVNGKDMTYHDDIAADWSYTATLDSEEATFLFTRQPGKTYTNTASIKDLHRMRPPKSQDWTSTPMKSGTVYYFGYSENYDGPVNNPDDPNEIINPDDGLTQPYGTQLDITLVPANYNSSMSVYKAYVHPDGHSFTFNAPAGKYILYMQAILKVNLQQSNEQAGGFIMQMRQTSMDVTVE